MVARKKGEWNVDNKRVHGEVNTRRQSDIDHVSGQQWADEAKNCVTQTSLESTVWAVGETGNRYGREVAIKLQILDGFCGDELVCGVYAIFSTDML